MAHEAQVRYSKLVDLKLRATLVKKVGVICNSRYEGSPKAGSVKVPVRDTEVAVNDYDKQTGAELTGGDTTYLTVNIDKDKAVNEIIDGFDAASVPDDLVADRLDSAGYSLALQVDSDGSAELTTAGTAFGTTTALTEKTIYGNIVDARTKLSTVHVPTEGRWLLVSPEIYGLLLKSPEFIKASRRERGVHRRSSQLVCLHRRVGCSRPCAGSQWFQQVHRRVRSQGPQGLRLQSHQAPDHPHQEESVTEPLSLPAAASSPNRGA